MGEEDSISLVTLTLTCSIALASSDPISLGKSNASRILGTEALSSSSSAFTAGFEGEVEAEVETTVCVGVGVDGGFVVDLA